MHEYLLLSDPRFRHNAMDELGVLYKQRIRCDSVLDKYFSVVSSNSEINENLIAAAGGSTFAYALMDLHTIGIGQGLHGVSDAISGLLTSGRTFRIFVRNLDHETRTPREIEILLGEGLDSEVHRADLLDPDDAICVLITKDSYLIGISKRKYQNYCIENIIHPKNTKQHSYINRAEFKLEEAIMYFGIDVGAVNNCIDVGASPGGWTDLMLKYGKKVVSIDNALMEYGNLGKYGRVLIITDNDDVSFTPAPDQNISVKKFGDSFDPSLYDLVHIMSNVDPGDTGKIESVIKKVGMADALLVDCNVASGEILPIVIHMSDFLNPGGTLIHTMKINRRNVMKYVSQTTNSLLEHYTNIRIKKLVHNRRELTLVATKK